MSTGLTCDLCSLPVQGNAYERPFDGAVRRFCCAGCLNVYSILSESGTLQARDSAAAYQAGARLGLIGRPSESGLAADASADFGSNPAVEREIEVPISGMWCSSCAWLIERVLLKQRGVLSCRVQFVSDAARVRYSPEYISRQQILDEIRSLGYEPVSKASSPGDSTQRDLLIRLGVACAPGMYMMMFNIYLYEGYFQKLDPGIRHFLQQLLFFLSLPILTWCAWPIYRRAWAALRRGATTMETLITLGAGSAFLYSVAAMVQGQQQVYFDTASMIVTLVLLGKYLEAVARARATSAVGSLNAMLPKKVRLRLPGGEERMATADQVQVGDCAIVDAGSTVPVDGIVVDGTAAVDESLLTGEPTPVRRGPGDAVVGASLCVEGGMVVRATRTGADTTVNRMASLVREALSSRSGSERLADRVSRVFVPSIIALAALVLIHQLSLHSSTSQSLMQGVSVLVVACPCALGMATPLAIAAAMGSAARRGILIRNSETLEKAPKIDTVVLDKTGTATAGRLQVVDVLLPRERAPERAEWEAVASLEALSQHPAARAITAWIRQGGYGVRSDVQVELIPGKGVRGQVGDLPVFVGAQELAPDPGAELLERAASAEREGKTVVMAAARGRFLCAFVLEDTLRPGSPQAVRMLKESGVEVWLVSGDSEATTAAVAASLGVDHFQARALPEDKIGRIRSLRAAGRSVAMVGDGINDGPALAEADLGVAMGEGTQVALEAADLALISPDLRRLPYAFQLSGRTVRVIRQNLFWALIYNAAIIPAAAGLYGERYAIGPLFAALAMLVSSLSVVFNSLRLQEGAPG